ncbi:hypothetical protein Tco_0361159 [Tanacetum coccineum]
MKEFTKAENNKERGGIQATNILSQGILRHIFNTLNQTETTKEIWDNVELLMQGSGLTEQQKKETLFDQYESLLLQPPARYFTNRITQATIQAGQITTESVQRRALGNKGKHAATGSQGNVWFKDKALLMEAKERGAILDAEAEAFLVDVDGSIHVQSDADSVSQDDTWEEKLDYDVDSVIAYDHD